MISFAKKGQMSKESERGYREKSLYRLNPDFEKGADKYPGYEFPLPRPIMEICDNVNLLGGRVLMVGGAVRDMILGLCPKDLDFEVYGVPSNIVHQLLGGWGPVDITGRAFEVFKLHLKETKLPVDFSSPRRESKTGPRHQDFSIEGDPMMSICEAAERRDLTINSLAWDPLTGIVYDCFGGKQDLEQGVLRVTSEKTFVEDPLRVLRLMQFATRFNFEIEPATKWLCQCLVEAEELESLSLERIGEEFSKMMSRGREISRGLEFVRRIGALDRLWPELAAMTRTPQEYSCHPEGIVWEHTLQAVDAAAQIAEREGFPERKRQILTSSALLHDSGKAETTYLNEAGVLVSPGHNLASIPLASAFLKRQYYSRSKIVEILTLIREHLHPPIYYREEIERGKNMNRALRRLADRLGRGRTNTKMLGFLVEADLRGRNPNPGQPMNKTETPGYLKFEDWFNAKIEENRIAQAPLPPLIKGGEVVGALGIEGGIWIGVVLRAIREEQLNGQITSRQQALTKAKELYPLFAHLAQTEAEKRNLHTLVVWKEMAKLKNPLELIACPKRSSEPRHTEGED